MQAIDSKAIDAAIDQIDRRLLDHAYKQKDVQTLVQNKFGITLSAGQEDIVRKIAFKEYDKFSISAYTRYGKTQSVSYAMALRIDRIPNRKIAFIGPSEAQASILRQYMAWNVLNDPSLLAKAQMDAKGVHRMVKEATKKRMTFSNGCEYQVFSAKDEADRLMGFGADDAVIDEACLIKRQAFAKISRMLGDNPEDHMEIDLYNPWEVDSKAYEHSIDPDFHPIRIPWSQGVKEGRTTREFVEQQRKEMTELQFTVLYESRFPTMVEGGLFDAEWIRTCQQLRFNFLNELTALRRKIASCQDKAELEKLRKELRQYRVIIACDPADKGLDWTVIWWGIRKNDQYQVCGWQYEATSDNMAIADRIWSMYQTVKADQINVDGHGIGVGVISRLQQIMREQKKLVQLNECLFGGQVHQLQKAHYMNLKAEKYFRLRDILKDGRIQLPDPAVFDQKDAAHKLMSDLLKIKWEKVSGRDKIRIIDPDKSPDFADALVYFTWDDHIEEDLGIEGGELYQRPEIGSSGIKYRKRMRHL